MSITDELRKWAQICGIKYDSKLYEIADNIDAAHRAALEKLAAQVDESEDGWVRKSNEHVISHATIEVTPHIDWVRMADELDEFVEIVRGMAGDDE